MTTLSTNFYNGMSIVKSKLQSFAIIVNLNLAELTTRLQKVDSIMYPIENIIENTSQIQTVNPLFLRDKLIGDVIILSVSRGELV